MTDRPSLHRYLVAMRQVDPATRVGAITRVMPTFVEADGPGVPLGSRCSLGAPGPQQCEAEVVKVEVGRVTLAPYTSTAGICVGDPVCAMRVGATIPVGPRWLGRVVDPLGRPLDGGAPLPANDASWPLAGVCTPPLDRLSPVEPLETGIRALDGLLTLGVGQRVGIFAGSGVGKTTLLASLARHVEADVCVLCLVGERGREAEEFWQRALSDSARARSTMVVATSDQPAVMRARSVQVALSLAEYFRAQGAHVLLLLDSVTRYALALREIGLAAGEPPTVRAYTPGVFAALPKIVERCGAIRNSGAITALMTVLTETDDIDDPMAETMRALLDGHIVLTRELAEQGHYPAIQVPRSISRVMQYVAEPNERRLAAEAVAQLAAYEASRTLVESGLYAPGSNPALDRALQQRAALIDFLRQAPDATTPRATTINALAALLREVA
ncbi:MULTISPECIES: FliI/YscN family ATPase [unclassified Paraburkholderia]|uniref:FliI/YscN family ATPase n=1 Tax=unclassified Paraburkholderia TaxID=2615204 RepID=UPI00160E2FBB|nr:MULTISPECIES: FliI/YscN family ATPase [unclassified Paraburkholderia]MBB5447943.1 flagellum-specific ATP synthase [Paraburkholderia sp. WSM4177]MBB5488358.1 flagellum-specific ATP synthase [Paraburkholderia sp. WSM4180]